MAKRKANSVKMKPKPLSEKINTQGVSDNPIKQFSMSELQKMIGEIVEKHVKQNLLPLKIQGDQRQREVDNIKANQITIQTLFMEKGLINEAEFDAMYAEICETRFGVVDDQGNMAGNVIIEIYNLEERIIDASS